MKASLDNDATSLSNFAVPFDEDGGAHAAKMRVRAGIGTAPAGDGRNDGLTGTSPPRLEVDSEEKPLMLTNGGVED